MLTWQTAYPRFDVRGLYAGLARSLDLGCRLLGRREDDVALIPPVQFRHTVYSGLGKPPFIAERSEEMAIRMQFGDFFHRRI